MRKYKRGCGSIGLGSGGSSDPVRVLCQLAVALPEWPSRALRFADFRDFSLFNPEMLAQVTFSM
jgi:hypothetical protein